MQSSVSETFILKVISLKLFLDMVSSPPANNVTTRVMENKDACKTI